MKKNIWIDIINPSHPLFFKPLINELKEKYDIQITLRDRAETVELSNKFNMKGEIVGKDYESRGKKILSTITRTMILSYMLKNFDFSISFENADCVTTSFLKKKKSILFLDNDLKYKINNDFIQLLDNKVKLLANYIFIPHVCFDTFKKYINKNKLINFHGYKEDFYIADYTPDKNFLNIFPFDRYIIIRPEALTSLYIKKTKTIIPELIKEFKNKNINIVYLPRDKSDRNVLKKYNIYIPEKALNGLDLVFYSDAVLSGSGTMAREAAIMGRPSVSFFPSDTLLSVDKDLIEKNKMIHSRDYKEIFNFVNNSIKENNKTDYNFSKSKKVKEMIIKEIIKLIDVT